MTRTLSQNGGKLSLQKITFSQPEGSKKNGRLKLRWFNSVLKDRKLFKVETWWKKALYRNIWGGGGGS
jgi:hypothetical protein